MELLRLNNFPIFKQLQLEEALLRLSDRTICLINEGAPPAVVMGISGKPEELVEKEALAAQRIPLIKRFSGGGTVVVDENTLFVSFLCQADLHPFSPYPEPIMRWTEELYREALSLPSFALRENDYVIGERKFGGNAQYLRKQRWVHHTTLLWDYNPALMELLKEPKRRPEYRKERRHEEFLTRLKDHLPSKETFIERLLNLLDERYGLSPVSLESLTPLLLEPHRQSTTLWHHPYREDHEALASPLFAPSGQSIR